MIFLENIFVEIYCLATITYMWYFNFFEFLGAKWFKLFPEQRPLSLVAIVS